MSHSGISFNIKLSNTHMLHIHTIKYDARLRNALIQILGLSSKFKLYEDIYTLIIREKDGKCPHKINHVL